MLQWFRDDKNCHGGEKQFPKAICIHGNRITLDLAIPQTAFIV